MVDAPGGHGRRARIAKSAVATGRGDDGTTGLLYGGRVSKDDPRAEAFGTVDEAVAALGLARAELSDLDRHGGASDAMHDLAALVLRLQRELFVVGAELATNPEARDRQRDGVTRVDEAMVERVEEELARYEAGVALGNEFIIPGETRISAALELARTVVRRAERRVIALRRDGLVPGEWLVPYLNRLADLVWVLARAAEAAEQQPSSRVPSRLRSPQET